MKFWEFFYNTFVVPLLWTTFHIGGMVNTKIKRGIIGREDLLENLQRDAALLRSRHRVWFHASSLGEFEQAKPIISALKSSYPDISIIATFFSPSGLDHSRNYALADIITYIPFDSRNNVNRFVDIIMPTAAIMVRYDIWPNMIWALRDRKIPTIIANATMREHSPRMMPIIRAFHTSLYDCFTYILTVSEADRNAFARFRTNRPTIEAIGDTRYDQVIMRCDDALSRHIVPESVSSGKKIFIVGQSWKEDEEVLLPVLFKLQKVEHDLLTIIVPHEPTVEHLEDLEYLLRPYTRFIRFSELSNYKQEPVILVDSVGVLVALYKYASIAYVGGSFQQGVHNVLEPAVFGIPVLYGPRHVNSQEAVELAKKRGGHVVENERDLYRTLRSLLDNNEERIFSGAIAEEFVQKNSGATQRFLKYLDPLLTQ